MGVAECRYTSAQSINPTGKLDSLVPTCVLVVYVHYRGSLPRVSTWTGTCVSVVYRAVDPNPHIGLQYPDVGWWVDGVRRMYCFVAKMIHSPVSGKKL